MKFPIKQLVFLICIFLTFMQCQNDEITNNPTIGQSNSEDLVIKSDFSVNLSDAINVAQKQIENTQIKNESQKNLRIMGQDDPIKLSEKEVKSTKTIKEKDVDLYHVINYKEGALL